MLKYVRTTPWRQSYAPCGFIHLSTATTSTPAAAPPQQRAQYSRKFLVTLYLGLTHSRLFVETPVPKRFWKNVNIDESNSALINTFL